VKILSQNVVKELVKRGYTCEKQMYELLDFGAHEDFKEILHHYIKAGGKRVRPALTIIVGQALGAKEEYLLYAAAAIELIHEYSLIIDDIIDRSEKRRNEPTLWKKYGISMALLAALHYRESIHEGARRTNHPLEIANLISETIRVMTEGERLDILFEQAGRDEEYIIQKRYKVVTVDDYMRMIGGKTASLISTACKVGAICADAKNNIVEKLGKFGWNIGLAFQITDDYLDLFAKEEELGKKTGKDILEHKLGNIVVIYALEELSEQEKQKILSILRKEKLTDDDVKDAIELIKKTNASQKAKEKANKLIEEAKKEIEFLEESEEKKLLMALADFVVQRTY